MEQEKKYDYFISYRRKSGGILQAEKMYEILKDSSIKGDVFWDLESIKEGTYPPQIENAIREVTHFVLLINSAFFKEKDNPDDWFFKEIRSALSSPGINHITPIFFDGVSSDLFSDERMPEDLKALSKCQKLVYSKDNATHFDLFVRDHFGLVKQGTFEGFGEMMRAVFNLTVNVTVNNDDHSTENNVNSKNTNTMTTTTINAEKVIKDNTFHAPVTFNL